MDVLIIGASIAGVAAADALRANGLQGKLTLVDADPNPPYDKPPLSKQGLMTGWESGKAQLRPEQHYADKNIDLVLGRRAVALDGASRSVRLDDGTEVTGDAVVLATGVVARQLPESSMLPGVFSIRSLQDSLALQTALRSLPKLVVVGGGFIGAEVAAVATKQGADVTIVEALDLPFTHIFGVDVAASLARRHEVNGVRLVCGTGVERLEGDGRVERVILRDGRVIDADVVTLGLGAVPAVGWLAGSGVKLDNGILCDQFGQTAVPGVYGAGDVASWWDPRAQAHLRIEHWTTAKEQGAAVGHNILQSGADKKTAGPVPYFWSDQYGGRLQFLGTSKDHDVTYVVHGSLDNDEYVVLYGRKGVLIGALGLAAARHVMAFRTPIQQAMAWEDVMAEYGAKAAGVAS